MISNTFDFLSLCISGVVLVPKDNRKCQHASLSVTDSCLKIISKSSCKMSHVFSFPEKCTIYVKNSVFLQRKESPRACFSSLNFHLEGLLSTEHLCNTNIYSSCQHQQNGSICSSNVRQPRRCGEERGDLCLVAGRPRGASWMGVPW